jgi:alkaline phosphatase
MRSIFILFLSFFGVAAMAQPLSYTMANTHSHNDYEQHIPFWMAYNEGFGSIEADIFLKGGALLVGHDTIEIRSGRTLEQYYLRPLDSCIRKNNGNPYADGKRSLQMLIDIKTDSINTLDALILLLKKYPLLTHTPSLKWAITGNRPASSLFASYPSFIWFDGVLHEDYSDQALQRICMMSDDFKNYSYWNGRDSMPDTDWKRLQQAVSRSHRLHEPVRFWRAPDFNTAWIQFIRLRVDYINTDHLHELAMFLKGLPQAGQ